MKKYTLIITGSRNIKDSKILDKALLYYSIKPENISKIICDDSFGISKHAVWFAEKHNIKHKVFPIEWNNLEDTPLFIKKNQHGEYNAAAPFVTAQKMIDVGDSMLMVISGYESTTCDKLIEMAKKKNIKIFIYEI
jgi:hypothetical protein